MGVIVANDAEEWLDLASHSFVPLTFPRTGPGFTARMDRRTSDDALSLSNIRTEPVLIDRTERLAARAMSDDVHISLQLNAPARVTQRGRVTPIAPGVITVTQTHRPFVLDYTRPGQHHIVLQISTAALGVSQVLLERAAGNAVAGRNPARDAYRSFVAGLFATPASTGGHISATDRDIVASLAAAMINHAFGDEPPIAMRDDTAFECMSAFIETHFASPKITPDQIADAAFVSRRVMYSIFADRGSTPASAIRDARMRAARDILSDDRETATPISDVAYRVGFTDITTFTRTFRRDTGLTPRDWRSQLVTGS